MILVDGQHSTVLCCTSDISCAFLAASCNSDFGTLAALQTEKAVVRAPKTSS